MGPSDSGVSGEGPGLPGPQTHELPRRGERVDRGAPGTLRPPLPPPAEQCLVPGPRPRGLLRGAGSPCRVLLLLTSRQPAVGAINLICKRVYTYQAVLDLMGDAIVL